MDPVICPHCLMDNPAIAKFCMHCGQLLRQRASVLESYRKAQAERRPVTVMFADMSGFTAMVERMGAEEVHRLINSCFDQLAPIIGKYGGTIDKFIGDEIMALFGAPVAHEDDPVRALRAALEIMSSLEDFNRCQGTDLGMHIGINTGQVVAGSIGCQGRQQYSVIGAGVNLAARLRNLSKRGEILLGPDTYRLTAPLFEFQDRGDLALKGKAEPVPVYKLLGSKAQPGGLRGLAGLSSPMVGREEQLEQLCQLGQALYEGQGGVALIIGEPGLGKSRLVTEWRRVLGPIRRKYDLRWVEGRCLSYGQNLAYHLLVHLLVDLVGVPHQAGESVLRAALQAMTVDLFGQAAEEVYPYLGHLLSLRLEGAARERILRLEPQALQARYLVTLRRLLQTQACQTPLVLVLEDVHWADPSSTDLLLKLLPLSQSQALLFCFVSRPNEDVPGWKLITAARELLPEQCREIVLHSLSTQDSSRLVANLLEIETLPDAIRQIILAKSEGNPFFVEEVIRMLIDREILVQEQGRWIARQEIESVDIPDNLQGLLLARIDCLPDQLRNTLRVASIIGRQFPLRVLQEVLRAQHASG